MKQQLVTEEGWYEGRGGYIYVISQLMQILDSLHLVKGEGQLKRPFSKAKAIAEVAALIEDVRQQMDEDFPA